MYRQALRSLVRRPGYAATAILTLALGIGTTTALFSMVDAVLVRPLPYPQADRLVTVFESSPAQKQNTSLVAPVRLDDWQARSETFDVLSGSYAESVTDTSGPDAERLEGQRVLPRFFGVFGVGALVGRTLTPDEERFGGPGAAVISEGLWERRYGRQVNAIGSHLTIAGREFAIVGVMPATFFARSIDVYLPAQLPPRTATFREARFVGGIGRMKAGVTMAQASADLDRVQRALAAEFPKTDRGWSVVLGDLKTARIGAVRRPLALVFGAVGLLLAIAIANVAALTLVQLRRRTRELAVRMAIGGARRQIVADITRESGLVALGGIGIGWLVATVWLGALRQMFATVPRVNEVALDLRALAFAALAGGAAAVVSGLVPVWSVTRRDVAPALLATARTVAGGRHQLQRGLVVAQIALSLLLVGSAGMLLRSYYNLSHVDVGFDASDVITFRVGAAWDEDRSQIGQLQRRLIETLEARPGVEAAGFVSFLPLMGATLRYQVAVDGLSGPESGQAVNAGMRMIGAGYLRALDVPLVAGEWCPPLGSDFKAPRTMLVNQRFAEIYGPPEGLVGRSARVVDQPGSAARIVGVIGNISEDGQQSGPAPYAYTCNAAGAWPDPRYVVRTRDARALIGDIRPIVASLSPTRAVFAVEPLADVVGRSLRQPRLDAQLLSLFAGAALTLAAFGLYTLFTLLVAEERRELGVRLALGARPAQVARLVIGGAGRLLAGGAILGLALTLAAGRVLETMLFGVTPMDASTIGVTLGVIGLVALAGVAIPARRAARVDPAEAIRAE